MAIERHPATIENITTRAQLVAFQERYRMAADWHEPDEQDVDAFPAIGFDFDNAVCNGRGFRVRVARTNDESGDATEFSVLPDTQHGYPEHGVFLFHHAEPVAFVNLALLLAMACGYEGLG